jgi:recombination protein RecR
MVEKSPTLVRLMQQLQRIPYLASKNIYRVTGYILALDSDKAQQLCAAILDAKKNIVPCKRCFTWQDREGTCAYCDSPSRDQSIICVVETWHELMAIEKTGGYRGAYHVLGGALSPLDGIEPKDLHIEELIQRVDGTIREIIIATNQTPEGEATLAYVTTQLKKKSATLPEGAAPLTYMLTCLARGVPVGASLEYIDRVTIYKALDERRPL